jgi:CPA1 family monovalent cation:H+ antiporter
MENETVFILLFIIATAVAIAVRRLHLPYTVALVLTGLVLGVTNVFQAPHLTRDLLFSIFLPGLVFEAAFHLDFHQFWRNRMAITSLAVPGVIAATALTSAILTPAAESLDFVHGFSWHYSLVFGALIAATDPIAVVALFKSLGAPRRLNTLIEGESLLNDGTGIVFFTLSLSIAAGTSARLGPLAAEFFTIVGLGAAVGAAIGLTIAQVIKQVDDPMIEITLTTIAAYGSFLAAEHLHYSGVIATVVAGMFSGNYAARTGMSPSTRVAAETFWEYLAFALNSIVFLLIGFEVNVHTLLASWRMIIVAYLVVTLGRSFVIFLVSALLRRSRERIPWQWSAVLTWGGLRGALPMVLVLSLPNDFPYRDLLISMTFGVVVISLLVNGTTTAWVLRWLGIVHGRETRLAYEYSRGRLQSANAALTHLQEISRKRFKDPAMLSALREEYEKRIEGEEERLRDLRDERQELSREEAQWLRRYLLMVEKDEVQDAYREGSLSQEAYDKLRSDIDARLLAVETEEPVK